MKINLEVNTENIEEVSDAVKILNVFTKNDESFLEIKESDFSSEESKEVVPSDDVSAIEVPDFDSISSFNEADNMLKLENEELKELVKKLKSEKKCLVDENKKLKSDIESLETEINARPKEIDLGENEDVEKYKEEIAKYKKEIEHLQKNVVFHKDRSDKNWEELKVLKPKIKELENKVKKLEEENIPLKDNSSSESDMESLLESIKVLEKEKVELSEKYKSLSEIRDKLMKDLDLYQGRSKENWEELKVLKPKLKSLESKNSELENKIKDLESTSSNINNKEEVDKLKTELFQMKSEYEDNISNLKLSNDKLQNEINLYKSKYSELDLSELNHLKSMKNAICGTEKGKAFWEAVESRF